MKCWWLFCVYFFRRRSKQKVTFGLSALKGCFRTCIVMISLILCVLLAHVEISLLKAWCPLIGIQVELKPWQDRTLAICQKFATETPQNFNNLPHLLTFSKQPHASTLSHLGSLFLSSPPRVIQSSPPCHHQILFLSQPARSPA